MRALLIPLLLAAACGGDDDSETCGADGADGGLTVGSITFSLFESSPNNDCTPAQGDPTSLTIQGEQSEPRATGFFVLCIPRPHEIENGVPISFTDEDHIQIVDLFGRDRFACDVRVEDASEATVTLHGYCDDGLDTAGYALALDGTMSVTRTCFDEDPVTEDVDVSGDTPVRGPATF